MTSSTSDELKKTFALASLRKEAAKILSAKEWKELQEIKRKFDDQKRFEKRSLELEYKSRVEVARKRLVNQAGQTQKRFQPAWARNDRFDKDAIERQAHRTVKQQFKQLIQKYDSQEAHEIRGLMKRSEHTRKLREKPRKDFVKAVDRRLGMERRQTRSRGLSR